LRAAGAEVVDIEMPHEFDDIPGGRHRYIQNGEARVNFLLEYMIDKDSLHPLLAGHVENKTNITRRMQLDAYDQLAALRPVVDRLASQYDAIVTPSVPSEAPMGLGHTGDARFCSMWTALHVPCVNIPGFASENGMPIGLTLVAPR
jgi:Asp-tRNA(Asn)/Glu-tRNA(Gln) amidotransferase A subunit family amidase